MPSINVLLLSSCAQIKGFTVFSKKFYKQSFSQLECCNFSSLPELTNRLAAHIPIELKEICRSHNYNKQGISKNTSFFLQIRLSTYTSAIWYARIPILCQHNNSTPQASKRILPIFILACKCGLLQTYQHNRL